MWVLITLVVTSGMPAAYLALIALLGLASVAEFFRIGVAAGVPCFPRFGWLCAAAYTAGLGYLLLGGRAGQLAQLDAAAVFVVVAGAFTLQLRRPLRGFEPLLAVGYTAVGFLYIALFFGFCARLVVAVPGAGAVPGAWLLVWLVAVTKCTDMGAYVVGSLVGRHKMIPHVSPGKTWEGFVGALFFAQLFGCGIYAWQGEALAALGGWRHVVVLNVVLALLAVVGDLAESILKRSVGAKDSGRFLPGIGGALDLIDSLCFTAPVLYAYVCWVVPAVG